MSNDSHFYNSGDMVLTLEEMVTYGKTSHMHVQIMYCLCTPFKYFTRPHHTWWVTLHASSCRSTSQKHHPWSDRDSKAATNGSPQDHMSKLITTINSCCVAFSFWQKENAAGKSSGIYDWTSLMGHEVKLLLAHPPDKLADVLHPENSSTVIQIWKVCLLKYNIIS